jgi:hypothetical protein
VTRSGRLLLSVIGAFAIATAGVTGAAAAPLEPSANLPAAGVITPDAAPAAPLEPSANLPAAQVAAPDAAPAAGQVTTTQEPADCAPTTNAGKPCDPVSPTGGTVSPNLAWAVTLAASALWVPPGAGVMLTATANQDVGFGIYYIYILYGATVVTSCSGGTTCSAMVTSATATPRSYTAVIDAYHIGTDQQATSSTVTVAWSNVDIEGTVRNASVGLVGITVSACVAPADLLCQNTTSVSGGGYSIVVAPNTTYDLEFLDQSGTYWYNFLSNVPVVTSPVTGKNVILQLIPPWTVTLAASATSVLAGTNVTLTATVNQNPFHSPFYLDIVDGNGAVVAYCTSGTTCVTSVTSATATSRTYRAVIARVNGSSEQATSSIVTVVWMTTISGTVRNAFAVPLAGIWVDACAGANCSYGTPTVANGSYSLAVPPNATYNMSFGDPSGTYFTWSDPSGVAVGTSPVTGIDATLLVIPPWTVTLGASATSVLAGANVILTATANQDVGPTPFYIFILDGNGSVLNDCGGGTTCSATVTSATATSRTYTAVIEKGPGIAVQATSSTITVTWGLDHLVLSPPNATIVAGGSRTYTAEGYDASNHDLGDFTSHTTFAIGGGGSCTGTSCTSTVAAAHTVTGSDGSAHGSTTLYVNPAALDHLVLSPANATVAAGVSQAYTAQGFDAYGNSLGDVTSGTILTTSGFGTCAGASCWSTTPGTVWVTGSDGGAFDMAFLHVTPAAATHLAVSGLDTPRVAGAAGSVTVTALDVYGNTATGYSGTVHFSSSDGAAVLPADATLSAGVGTFSVTLRTAGTQSVTATDTGNSSITGVQSGIVVTPAAVKTLVVSGLTTPRTAGTTGSIRVTALDAYGNRVHGYTGTIKFTSSDTKAKLPASYKFTAADAGTHVFSGVVILKTAGTQSVTVTDTVTKTIKGVQAGIVVKAAAVKTLVVSGLSSPRIAGTAGNISGSPRSTPTATACLAIEARSTSAAPMPRPSCLPTTSSPPPTTAPTSSSGP